jgi:Uma2 family endonuclease
MSEAALPPRMSLKQFLDWQEGQEQRYELVDGEPVAMAGAKQKHDRIVMNAVMRIGTKLDGNPCRPFSADQTVVTGVRSGRHPDFSVDCSPFEPESMVATLPRVVLEVFSPSTRSLDQVGKLDEYKAVASIEHIILVDPDAPMVILWSRTEDRSWHHETLRGLDAVLALPAVRVEASLADLYAGLTFRPRPRLASPGSPDEAP